MVRSNILVDKFRVALARVSALVVMLALLLGSVSCAATNVIEPEANNSNPQTVITLSNEEIQEIAKEAYKYGYPIVENYRNIYSFIFSSDEDTEPSFNEIQHATELITPKDRQVVTPNSDTLYSYLPLDLRDEPIVLTLPDISNEEDQSEPDRYYSVQLIDLYTHNFDYLGTRTTGNQGGDFLIVGPSWDGKIPDGADIDRDKIYPCESEIALALYRTQVFNESDLENVYNIQALYDVKPLSEFSGNAPRPIAAPIITLENWPTPPKRDKDGDEMETPVIFESLNFLLDLAPPHPTELGLMEELEKINVGRGLVFDAQALKTEQFAAIQNGINNALDEEKDLIGSGETNSGDLFGQRCFLRNNYLYRFAGAKIGIYGNDRAEAFYPLYDSAIDSEGNKVDLNASDGASYTLTFARDKNGTIQYPPAGAFWSLTMYGKDQFLVPNSAERYLLNSPMVDDFQEDDNGVTLYIQSDPPPTVDGYEFNPNWLPAPKREGDNGEFSMVMRLYLPSNEVLEGNWVRPEVMLVSSAQD
jgi:hypothetical protein